jgi:hypothetical protein
VATVIEKCDEKRVREIIKDELGKVENNEDTIDSVLVLPRHFVQ